MADSRGAVSVPFFLGYLLTLRRTWRTMRIIARPVNSAGLLVLFAAILGTAFENAR